MSKQPLVALLIETSNSYARGLLRGISAYLREHRPWSIHLPESRRGESPPNWLKTWRGDGIIARIETRRIARAISECRTPTVDVSAGRLVPELPCVETDNEEVARLAFDHLYEHGFRNLAYCGDDRFCWSIERRKRFQELADKRACTIDVYRGRSSAEWKQEEKHLTAWVRRLPKPCGIMSCYDIRGGQVLDVCRRAGIAVPDEIAVIGVDNDDLICTFADPPLSSVIPNTHQTGYEAAALLDRLMAGEVVELGVRLIRPTGIVTRQSSEGLATADAEVSTAMRYIRNHACDGLRVKDLLRAVPISRRVLESRFRKLLGRTPQEEIARVQMRRVKQLLEETDLPVSAIAELAGFKHLEYLTKVFKRHFGKPPGRFRTEHRS